MTSFPRFSANMQIGHQYEIGPVSVKLYNNNAQLTATSCTEFRHIADRQAVRAQAEAEALAEAAAQQAQAAAAAQAEADAAAATQPEDVAAAGAAIQLDLSDSQSESDDDPDALQYTCSQYRYPGT